MHYLLGPVQNNGEKTRSRSGSLLPDTDTIEGYLYRTGGMVVASDNVNDSKNTRVPDDLSRSTWRIDCNKKGAIMFRVNICKSIFLTLTATITVGVFETSAFAQEVDPKALLEQMSVEIAGLDSFIVHGDAYADARLDAGQIIEHASQVTLRLRRQPGSIRITNRDAEDTREIYFDHSTRDNFYAQTEIPQGVESMLDFAVNEVGIEAPLLDFVSMNIADNLVQDADEVVAGKTCHQLEMGGRIPEICCVLQMGHRSGFRT
jgi:hypothetical protein